MLGNGIVEVVDDAAAGLISSSSMALVMPFAAEAGSGASASACPRGADAEADLPLLEAPADFRRLAISKRIRCFPVRQFSLYYLKPMFRLVKPHL